MGVQTQITITCDYPECKCGQNGPAVVSWDKSSADSGKSMPPPEAQYLVVLSVGGETKSFCCQLHSATYFLPPGYEIKQKKLVPFPENPGWKDSPENGKEDNCESLPD